jgi:hypothetical protein
VREPLKYQAVFVSTVLVLGVVSMLSVITISALGQSTRTGNKTANNMTNATHANGAIVNKTIASIALSKGATTSRMLPTGPK